MNCCALTASKERRELSRMAEWMRARRCLAQNRSAGLCPAPAGSAMRQASTEPSPTNRASAERISPSVPVPIEADSSSGVTGPRISRWPRAAATRASSLAQAGGGAAVSSLWSGSNRAPSPKALAVSRCSTATHRVPEAGSSRRMARPAEMSASIHFVHSGLGGASTSEHKRSCSSSALRSSGRACSMTPATVAGSSAARSRASSGRPRRVATARVRRSSSGASSRKV